MYLFYFYYKIVRINQHEYTRYESISKYRGNKQNLLFKKNKRNYTKNNPPTDAKISLHMRVQDIIE